MLASTANSGSPAADLAIRVLKAPRSGVCISRVSLSPALDGPLGGADSGWRVSLRAANGGALTAYVIADPTAPTATSAARRATLVFPTRAPGSGLYTITDARPLAATALTGPTTVQGGGAALTFDPAQQGGLPHAIRYRDDGAELRSYNWNDRVHHAERGGWMLRHDRSPRITALVRESGLAVLRVVARYCSEDGTPDPGAASATYDWYVFGGSEDVFCQAFVAQNEPREWNELHHLEFNVSDDSLVGWAGGDPMQRGALSSTRRGWVVSAWGGLLGKRHAIGIIAPEVRLYDGRGEYGTYVHGAWEAWSSRDRALSAWLWIASADDPAASLERAANTNRRAETFVTPVSLDRRIAELSAPGKDRNRRWMTSLADRLRRSGDLSAAARFVEASGVSWAMPPSTDWIVTVAADAALALSVARGGVRLTSLYDLGRGCELAAADQPPLFRILLRKAERGPVVGAGSASETAEVSSDSGWSEVTANRAEAGFTLRLGRPADQRFRGISVAVRASPDPSSAAWHWTISVTNRSREWGIERVAFPQVAIEPPGSDVVALYPTGPGVLHDLAAEASLNRASLYPNGWCTMQLMAVYSPTRRAGLYFGLHDPVASSKHIVLTRDAGGPVRMLYDMPAPGMGRPGTGFELQGLAVWRLLRGDWFDAARFYRSWVVRNARWFPKLGHDGRTDTPEWMKGLCAWAQTGGSPAECVEAVKDMQRALGVPIGFHWYNWHQIPFDNDYPHYFPTKAGVAEGVADLQRHDVYVMPYINGRLWDTRDRGTEDAEFTARALPSATKDAAGKPYIETYGSKEADGSTVRLAVMCPTTSLWQTTVREIVLRLMGEVGAKAVYIDQIAAAAPALCMDPTHGHTLGGGSWWTERGYWPLLKALRERMPNDRMVTTECAAEPYTSSVDGYLTWDWQAQGMVPMLPAIYGGAVQYFGRNYAAGTGTRDLALCMKMGQQLVFGEQIGWLDPRISSDPVAGAFLRLVVRTRSRYVAYWSRGEMARPPRLMGELPAVRADWAWFGETWVSTPAVLTGAWTLPRERRLLLLFVNVSDREVRSVLAWNARSYGITAAKLTFAVLRDPDAPLGAAESMPVRTQRVVALPPRSLQAWEVRW